MANELPPFSLVINGEAYYGWTEVRITRSLDQFAHSFEMTYVDRWAEGDAPRQLVLGAACVARYDAFDLITGWLDNATIELGSSSVSANAAGRSKTGDLVDCAALNKTGQWRKQTAATIIRDLVKPFGIKVKFDPALTDTTKIPRFDLEDGETVFDAIDRLARLRAWLPITTAAGDLDFARISKTAGLRIVTLPVADTIRRQVQQDQQNRFSSYRIRSQTGRSSPTESPRRAALEKYEVSDPAVSRYRPTVVSSTTGARLVELQEHATWIMNTRAAQSERVTYEIPGILAPDKKPWEPGMLVSVDDSWLGINDVLVVATTNVQLDAQRFTTTLELTRTEAFAAEPIPNKKLIHKAKKI